MNEQFPKAVPDIPLTPAVKYFKERWISPLLGQFDKAVEKDARPIQLTVRDKLIFTLDRYLEMMRNELISTGMNDQARSGLNTEIDWAQKKRDRLVRMKENGLITAKVEIHRNGRVEE